MRVSIFFIICILSYSAQAQWYNEEKQNHLYLELGGVAMGPGSVNYERLFLFYNFIITTRLGVGYYMEGINPLAISDEFAVFPLTSSILLGGDKFYFELGLGPVFSFTSFKGNDYNYGIIKWYSGIAGLRYQNLTGRFSARLVYTPRMYNRKYDPSYLQYPQISYRERTYESFIGLSFGYSF
ncbi:MAG: hypothetical protein ACNS60_13090 [Candidatus Cyclobacteriaceae bacterium M2_1C_046]